ncbi:MAG: alkaline phosphatase D family protein [Alphaproteobacteria bacterium]|nr:alkaline phosphatase D family protein [Alphaproteobacteria bacterium]
MSEPAHTVTRRQILRQAGAVSSLPLLGALGTGQTAAAVPKNESPLFTLGVASGEPGPDRVVIWTRLARDPLHGGGMPDAPIDVGWTVATDDAMRTIVRQGTVTAQPEFAHSVHVDVQGLEPHRWYWYRFHVGSEESPVGRTRTAPAAGQGVDRFRFAFASCQKYEDGYYTAYRHLAAEDLDLVLHLGDYIYEGKAKDGQVRKHNSAECKTLVDYRNRYAQYKLDPDLQAAHAAFPWAVAPDDHEVDNNYANDKEEELRVSSEEFLARRAAAYHAYYEHLPFRRFSRPNGPHMQLYRALTFGGLATVHLLDTRQYRTDQPCGRKWVERCADALKPRTTILGKLQEAWLDRRLAAAEGHWTVLAQQVPMMQRKRPRNGQVLYHMDKWDGYVAARQRLFDSIQRHRPRGLVAVCGDVHAAWAGVLKADFDDPKSATLGAEFVGTSIASGGDGWEIKKTHRDIVDANPHIAFYNGRRGYTRCDLTRDRWRTDYRIVPYVSRPGAPVETVTSFVVEPGASALVKA